MITGEEIWIEKLNSNEQYDEFFSKKKRRAIRNKLKKIKIRPPKILRPSKGKGFVGRIIRKKKKKKDNRPAAVVNGGAALLQQEKLNRQKVKPKSIVQHEEKLLQDIKKLEEKKLREEAEITQKKTELEQKKIDLEYGNAKKEASKSNLLFVGFIGVVLVLVLAKSLSRKNQLKSLELELAKAKIPTP